MIREITAAVAGFIIGLAIGGVIGAALIFTLLEQMGPML